MAEIPLTRKHRSSKLEGGSAQLAAAMTGTGGSDYANCFGYLIRTIEVENLTAADAATFTVQGGFRRTDDTIDWYTLATRADASASFSTSGVTVNGASAKIVEVSPTPVTDYIRINVSDAAATQGINAWVHVEV